MRFIKCYGRTNEPKNQTITREMPLNNPKIQLNDCEIQLIQCYCHTIESKNQTIAREMPLNNPEI